MLRTDNSQLMLCITLTIYVLEFAKTIFHYLQATGTITFNNIYHDQPIMSYSIRRTSNQVNTMGQTTKQHKHPIITTSQLYGQLSQSRHMMAIVYSNTQCLQ